MTTQSALVAMNGSEDGAADVAPLPAVDPLEIVTTRIGSLQCELEAMTTPLDVTGSERERLAYEALRTQRQQSLAKFTAARDAFERGERNVLAATHAKAVFERWTSCLAEARKTCADRLKPLPQIGRDRIQHALIKQLEQAIDVIDGRIEPPTPLGGSVVVLPDMITAAMNSAGFVRQSPDGPHRNFGGWPWLGSRKDSEKQLAAAEKKMEKALRERDAAWRTLEALARS